MWACRTEVVPSTSPMRRGLKDQPRHRRKIGELSSVDFPDEEGTESHIFEGLVQMPGLRSVDFPDEEGTERSGPRMRQTSRCSCSVDFPDEEGTERAAAFPFTSIRFPSSVDFPDEEGTERYRRISGSSRC